MLFCYIIYEMQFVSLLMTIIYTSNIIDAYSVYAMFAVSYRVTRAHTIQYFRSMLSCIRDGPSGQSLFTLL